MAKECGLIHANNNIVCSIRINISGPIPRFHDLIEICILPLNSLWEPSFVIMPFFLGVQMKRPENYDHEKCKLSRVDVAKLQLNGIEAYQSAALFDEWFEKLCLGRHKKILLVTHDWSMDREFVLDWLGSFEAFTEYFDPGIRDLETAALYSNDKADYHAEPAPYPKTYLQYLSTTLGVECMRNRDLVEDCKNIGLIYKRLLAARF